MASFTGKTFSSFYKNILSISRTGNTGMETDLLYYIQDGNGDDSCYAVSQNNLFIRPQAADSTSTFVVANNGSDHLLKVDSTNKKVLVNESQTAANTQYAIFGANYIDISSFAANKHYPIAFTGAGASNTNDVDFGTGTDPDDSFTTANTDTQYASQIVPMIWRLPDNITISSVTHIEGADNATGDTTRMHLKSFDFTSGSTSCLTNGTLLGHNTDITNAGNEQAYLSTWTVDSADVNADKAILCFFRSDGINSDYSITVTVKYFIR